MITPPVGGVTCFAEHVQRTEVCQVYLFSTCLFLLFCPSNPGILRPCVNKALVVDHLNKHFSASVVIAGLAC